MPTPTLPSTQAPCFASSDTSLKCKYCQMELQDISTVYFIQHLIAMNCTFHKTSHHNLSFNTCQPFSFRSILLLKKNIPIHMQVNEGEDWNEKFEIFPATHCSLNATFIFPALNSNKTSSGQIKPNTKLIFKAPPRVHTARPKLGVFQNCRIKHFCCFVTQLIKKIQLWFLYREI